MSWIDANREIPPGLGEHDAIIVGAGAAGIFLAVTLAARKQRVLLLETGHLTLDDDRQALNEIEETGKRLSNALWCRKRAVGGTTTAWGGQALPFRPLDFEPRSWVPSSGWPIAAADLANDYAAAEAFLGLDRWNFDTDLFARLGRADPGFDRSLLDYHFSKWAPQPDFLKLCRGRLGRAVTVLYNAQLLRIDLHPSGRVAQIVVSSFARRTQTIAVKGNLILAAGAIETNRILLLNRHQLAGGLGNQGGRLGRAFMEHPCVEAGIVEAPAAKALAGLCNTRWHRRRKYSVRLSAAAEWQRGQRLLNASASVLFRPPPGAPDPVETLRQFRQQPSLRRLFAAGRSVARLTPLLATLAAEGFIYKPGARAGLVLMTEQAPSDASRIDLSDRTDRFGMPMARLNWRIDRLSWLTAVACAEVVRSEMARLGLATVRLHPHLNADNPDWERHLSDVNHHMGGTPMSATPAQGVVDPNLQVWGIPNCFVASASVFPTSSHSNPTLTLLALSARLARHLQVRAA
jgi:choline dehydrogenase-like flavoprotein